MKKEEKNMEKNVPLRLSTIFISIWIIALLLVAAPPVANAQTRAGALTLNSKKDARHSAVIDVATGYAYFGTYTGPGRIFKVRLDAPLLYVSVKVDKTTYNQGEAVSITGIVIDGSGNPVWEATVSISAKNPAGVTAFTGSKTSDTSGAYSYSVTLGSNAVLGTYVVSVTASKSGYTDGQTQVTYKVVPEFPEVTLVMAACLLLATILMRKQKIRLSNRP